MQQPPPREHRSLQSDHSNCRDGKRHVVTDLLRRRQEIADALELAQDHVRQLVLDIDALDATIRLFQSNAEIGMVRVRPTPIRHQAISGESSRMLLGILRDADGPVATRDQCYASWRCGVLNAADTGMYEAMRRRVGGGAQPAWLRERGRVQCDGTTVTGVKWQLPVG